MALPRQIQEAEDAANAILAQQAGEPANEDVATEPQQTPEPEAGPHEVVETPPVRQEAPAPQHDVWEARYKSLQGVFNKEVPELQGRVKTLESQLQDAVARLNRASEQQESKPVQPEMSAKDVENFGSDLVEMVNRVATAHLGRVVNAVDAKLSKVDAALALFEKRLQGTSQHVSMTAEQMFFERLAKLVPEYEAINADQRFLAWLSETDPVYGVPRQAALAQAQEQLNADRAAAVFRAFTGPAQLAPKSNPMDRQVSPKGSASAAPTPQQPRMVSQSEITKFYDDVRRGMYRGREKDAAQKEAEFNLALSEGRVR